MLEALLDELQKEDISLLERDLREAPQPDDISLFERDFIEASRSSVHKYNKQYIYMYITKPNKSTILSISECVTHNIVVDQLQGIM